MPPLQDLKVRRSFPFFFPNQHHLKSKFFCPFSVCCCAEYVARVLFFNVGLNGTTAFTEEAALILAKDSYGVRSSAFDPLGMLYLGTGGPPGRSVTFPLPPPLHLLVLTTLLFSVIQIDMTHRNYEFTYRFTDAGTQAMDSMTFDPVANILYVGSVDISYNSIIYGFAAAWACEQSCHNRGTCEWRHCTCNSYTSPRGNTFTYNQPWCGTSPCDLGTNGLACSGAGTCNDGTLSSPPPPQPFGLTCSYYSRHLPLLAYLERRCLPKPSMP